MGAVNTPWTPPADFIGWAVIESNLKLARRYGTSPRSVRKALAKLPGGIREARAEHKVERKAGHAIARKLRRCTVIVETARSPVGIALYRETHGEHAERLIRAATMAFETHYCDVADRHPAWPILGYAA